MGILLQLLGNYSPVYFQKVIDNFTNGTLTLYQILIYGAIWVVLCVLYWFEEYPWNKLYHGIYLDIKLAAMKKVSRIDYQAYQKLGTGKLVQQIENGAEAGRNIIFEFWMQIIRGLAPSIIFSMFFITRISLNVVFLMFVGYVIVFIITNLLLKLLYSIKEKILTNEEKLNHYLVRGFMEMVVFRTNRRFASEIKKAENAKDEIVSAKVKMKLVHEIFFASFHLIVIVLKICVIIYAWSSQNLSIGQVVALLTLVDNAYSPIAIFNVIYVQYKLDHAALKRYKAFLESPNDEQFNASNKINSAGNGISVKNLSFKYGEREIFNSLSIDIKGSAVSAFVGESGSGKSTLIKILAGLLKPYGGSITVEKTELSEINLDSLYEHVAYIPQESPVFDGSLRENIIFDEQISDDKVLEAIKNAELYEFYKKLDNGLDTEIGERGVVLSGGERQRLAFARLWFSTADVIILDEATSAMDNLTEETVMRNVTEKFSGRTLIITAHRLSSVKTIENCTVTAFRDGKIEGSGSFDELLETSVYFNDLYHISDTAERTSENKHL